MANQTRRRFHRMPRSLPLWPRKDSVSRLNIGLQTDFRFFHDPVQYGSPNGSQTKTHDFEQRSTTGTTDQSAFINEFARPYCEPKGVSKVVTHFLRNTLHGSLLVTGYRGVGKTSAVNRALIDYVTECFAKADNEIQIPVIMHLDLSSVSSAHDLLLLLFEVLNDKLGESNWWSSGAANLKTFALVDKSTNSEYMPPKESSALNALKNLLGQPSLETDKNSQHPKERSRAFEDLQFGIDPTTEGFQAFLSSISMAKQTGQRANKVKTSSQNWTSQLFPGDSYYIDETRLSDDDQDAQISRKFIQWVDTGDRDYRTLQDLKRFLREECLNKLRRDVGFEQHLDTDPDGHSSAYFNSSQGSTGSHMPERHLSLYQYRFRDFLSKLADIQFVFRSHLKSTDNTSGGDSPDYLRAKLKVVFVIDELDKLPVRIKDRDPEQTEDDRFHEVQRLVADLKFLLTEGNSHQIFIAGKDVEDAWHTDRNKREGLFESVFPRNLYIGTLFTNEITPVALPTKSLANPLIEIPHHSDGDGFGSNYFAVCPLGVAKALAIAQLGASESLSHADLSAFYWKNVANACGITENSLSYRTALLILPYLSWTELNSLALTRLASVSNSTASEYSGAVSSLATAVRMCRNNITRIRIFIHHLTYKGRGIPRKIMREFYAYINDRSLTGPPHLLSPYQSTPEELQNYASDSFICRDLILSIKANEIQRMGFYSRIMDLLEQNFDRFRTLSDKGCVSIFYLIDHILKFYETGFTTHEITGAEGSSTRQEIFPTQWLASEVISILDGHLLRRRSLRSKEFYLLPHVKHDLRKLVRNYPGEQVELRFAEADFETELEMLDEKLLLVNQTYPAQRIESVQSQVRQGIIFERLGRLFDARLAYAKAIRWLRHDLTNFSSDGTSGNHAPYSGITKEFRKTFVSLLVQVLHRLGRIYEEENELQSSLRCYEEALTLHEICLQEQISEQTTQKKTATECTTSSASTSGPERWPYESDDEYVYGRTTFGDMMLSRYDLRRATPYTQTRPSYRDSVRPMAMDHQVEGFSVSLNHAALAHEKLWERSSANGFLIRSLNYLHFLQDEFGVVEQMFGSSLN